LSEAFGKADNILTVASKGIAEIITVAGYINVDFEDVRTVMKDSGVAIMGSGVAEGENRAHHAIEAALSSPLLNDNDIEGASDILLYLASGADEISMDEVDEITGYIQNQAGLNAEIIWGNGFDESLGNKISITLIATGFESKKVEQPLKEKEVVVHKLDEKVKTEPKEQVFQTVTEIKKVEPKKEEVKVLTEQKIENKKEAGPEEAPEKKKVVFDLGDKYPEQQKPEKENKIPEPEKTTPPPVPPVKSDVHEDSDVVTETPADETTVETEDEADSEKSSIEKKSKERIKKLRELSIKLKTPGGLAELENEPAYVRKNVNLTENTPSSESEVSRYSLSEGKENDTEMRTNNSFLHDNVD
jgi:cell division protein FtsZ